MYPILIQVGGLTIRSYGVLVATAFLVAVLVASREAARKGIGSQAFMDLTPFIIIGGLVGARLWHVGMHLGEFMNFPAKIVAFWHGGLAIQGGILGGVGAGVWIARRREIPVWKLADTIAPAAALGTAIGRLACLMSGDSYGTPTNLPWGMTFSDPNALVPIGLLGVKLHPTQLYTSSAMLVVFGVLWVLRDRFRREGALFLAYLILYSIVRFGVEFFRGDRAMLGPLSVAQFTAVATVLIAIFFLWQRYHRLDNHVSKRQMRRVAS